MTIIDPEKQTKRSCLENRHLKNKKDISDNTFFRPQALPEKFFCVTDLPWSFDIRHRLHTVEFRGFIPSRSCKASDLQVWLLQRNTATVLSVAEQPSFLKQYLFRDMREAALIKFVSEFCCNSPGKSPTLDWRNGRDRNFIKLNFPTAQFFPISTFTRFPNFPSYFLEDLYSFKL